MLYVGMTTTNVRTRFDNHRSCIKNYKRNILLYDHFCGPGHEISDCKAQIIFHLETDDNDAKDVLLAKEEYYMRMLSTLYPFGLKDNVNSLNTNIKTYNFKQFNCLNTPFFSYAQPRKKRSHGHRKKYSSQTALDFISKIKNLYTAREHRTLYTLLRSVSHQYTIYHIASACNSIRIELYQIILEFYLHFCEPKKAQTILCISLYHLSTRCRKKMNLNRILNSKDVKSQLPLQAKKFKIYVSYKYGPTIGETIFNYNKVFSTLPVSKDGDMLACDCKRKFPEKISLYAT